MAPVLAPWQAGREMLCCLYLGARVGARRAVGPRKGRGAFLPDMARVGMLLLFLQSYAAGYSDAGNLRWYMVASGFLGALAAHGLLAPVTAQVWRLALWPGLAMARLVGRRALQPAFAALRARREARRAAKAAKTAAEKQKKSLPKEEHLLYNSSV